MAMARRDHRKVSYGTSVSSVGAVVPELVEPRDQHNLVLLTCGVIGVAMLLPMNFYFNADSYWKYKWRRIENVTQPFDLGINMKHRPLASLKHEVR